MEYTLPKEILVYLFLKLTPRDLQSVSATCTYWRDIVNDFNMWEPSWHKLLKRLEHTYVNRNTYLNLKHCNTVSENFSLQRSCIRLYNTLYNAHNEMYNCFRNNNVRWFGFGILKTHYNQVLVKFCKYSNLQDLFSPDYFFLMKVKNLMALTNKEYTSFRSVPDLLTALNQLFDNDLKDDYLNHLHIHKLIYSYPMGLAGAINQQILQFLFQRCHVSEIIFIPRVVTLCENLELQHALVVYSTCRSTEVAVVLDGIVPEGRWREIMVGGWRIAENLYNANHLLRANQVTVADFEQINYKSKCWIRTNPMTESMRLHAEKSKANSSEDDMYKLKDEQYLAAEIMYNEMKLPEIIQELLQGIPSDRVTQCLHHILLAGGNCQLKFLNIRLRSDLMKLMPDYAPFVTTSVHNGSILAYTPPITLFDVNMTKAFQIGRISRLRREHYIIGNV